MSVCTFLTFGNELKWIIEEVGLLGTPMGLKGTFTTHLARTGLFTFDQIFLSHRKKMV